MIILDLFPLFTFTTYYGPLPPLWELATDILCPPSKELINFQKGCIPGAVHSLMSALTYHWWYIRFTSGTIDT